MELEDIKKNWKEMLEARIDALENQNAMLMKELRSKRVSTARQRLMRKYGAITIVCILAPLTMFSLGRMVREFQWIEGYFLLFFQIMAVICFIIWLRLYRTDYNRLSVKQALQSVYDIERLNNIKQWLGMLLGLPLMGMFLFQAHQLGVGPALYGGYVGIFIGALVGWRVRRRILQDLREMREELEEE